MQSSGIVRTIIIAFLTRLQKSRLQDLGYTMLCPELPSVGADPPRSLHDDARHIRAELELLIEHGEEIVVVMHSYGGMVGTQAAAGLGLADRARKGRRGGVMRLFYACAFMLPAGFDLDGSLGGLPPWIIQHVSLLPADCDGCC
jgi:pimeloyl-ACP methyl ester carboxylesterase